MRHNTIFCSRDFTPFLWNNLNLLYFNSIACVCVKPPRLNKTYENISGDARALLWLISQIYMRDYTINH